MTRLPDSDVSHEFVPTSYSQRARLSAAHGVDRWLRPPSGLALRIKAAVDENLLAEALAAVARQHSALRTFFPSYLPPDRAACIRAEEASWPLSTADQYAAGSLESALPDWVFEPFVPEAPPLLRAALLHKTARDHNLLLAIDHLNFDGGSVPILLEDLTSIWRLLSEGAELPPLSDMPLPYDRFVRWQQDWVDRKGEEAFAYWAPRWKDTGPYPEFPFPDPEGVPAEGSCTRTWERALSLSSIERRGQRLEIGDLTPFVLMAAALLNVINNRLDVPCPSLIFPFANRKLRGSPGAVGYYNNRLLLQVILNRRASFRETVSAARASLIEAIKYGSLPYSLVGDRLFPGELSRRPGNKFLYFSMIEAGRKYAVPGGSATEFPIDTDGNLGSYPAMFVTYVINQSDGTAILRCTYSSLCYGDREVDLFMGEVLAIFQEGR